MEIVFHLCVKQCNFKKVICLYLTYHKVEMRLFYKITFLLTCLCIACNPNDSKRDYILTERNLIPEGIAVSNKTGTIYVSSTFKRKIVQITAEGEVSDFISEKYDGIASVLGMEVDETRGILWANIDHANEVLLLKDPNPLADWKSSICSFDIQTKKRIRQYDLPGMCLPQNQLTIGSIAFPLPMIPLYCFCP